MKGKLKDVDWSSINRKLSGSVTAADAKVLALLIKGLSTPKIAAEIGEHRSNIWRKVQQLKTRAEEL